MNTCADYNEIRANHRARCERACARLNSVLALVMAIKLAVLIWKL